MEEQITPVPEAPTTAQVVDIQFRPGQKVYYFDPNGLNLHAGDHVIIDTARGPEYGICTTGNHVIPTSEVVAPLRCVLRLATAQDEKIAAENQAKEKQAYNVCLQKIAEHNLDMQLVSAEYAFDGSKILFFFTADERVDFRELVKNLAGAFHTRIELRQIGVRDKAKMVGGLGICGRPFCCASFLDDFQPVSIKMAKTQNLSLNPTKISGTCGRLMCCLKYEQEAYEDLIRTSPKMDYFVDPPEGRGTVVEVVLLRQRVKVKMEDRPEVISVFANGDIAVLRSGKAKKNDPPIPADLAPISGSGKRVRREEPEETVMLDAIKFRYSTETIAEDTAAPEFAEEESESLPDTPAEQEVKPSRSRRRNRRGKSQGEAQEKPQANAQEQEPPKSEKPRHKPDKKPAEKAEKPAQKPEKAEKAERSTEQQPQEADAADKPKRPRRRPNYHRRKPKASGEGSPKE